MEVFEFYTDREQEMEAEGKILEHERQFPNVGKCLACLTPDSSLDEDGLCDRPACQGADEEHRQAILSLVTPN